MSVYNDTILHFVNLLNSGAIRYRSEKSRIGNTYMEPYKPPNYYHNNKHREDWEDPFLILLILVTLIFIYYVSRTLYSFFSSVL